MSIISGGLIGIIPDDKLVLLKEPLNMPKQALDLVNYMRFRRLGDVTESTPRIYGSFNYRLQPYPSDVDSFNKIMISSSNVDKVIKITVKELQHIVSKIMRGRRILADIKAGLYKDGEAVHWTGEEILAGKRNGSVPDFNKHLGEKSLYDAVQEPGIVKIDMLTPYFNTYIECTMVYLVFYTGGALDSNFLKNGFNQPKFFDQLIADTTKQWEKNRHFKAIKRIFSNARIRGDIKTIKVIDPLLLSNVSKLGAMLSDLKTMHLILQLGARFDINIFFRTLQRMKNSVSTILDIPIDADDFAHKVGTIYRKLSLGKRKDAATEIENLAEMLLDITNKETDEYLHSVGINNISDFGPDYAVVQELQI